MQRIVVWGTGKGAEKAVNIPEDSVDIVAFVDNREAKQGGRFLGKPVISPSDIRKYEYDKIVICSVYFNEIKEQILQNAFADERTIENSFYFNKLNILKYYGQRKLNQEEQEVIDYIQDHPLGVFNYTFAEKYRDLQTEVYFDKEHKMFYVFFDGKKMYFSKKFENEEHVREYYRSVLMEQDEASPHRYFDGRIKLQENSIIVDAGVAEGNFALSVIDYAKKIYIIESDEMWVEALKLTFEPYRDKVVFVPKFLSDQDDEYNITLDTLLKDESVDIIKMDIEGYEKKAVKGGLKTILHNYPQMVVCTYHEEQDEESIRGILQDTEYTLNVSDGYMIFIQKSNYSNGKEPKKMVRGLLFARKEE